jgi:hypothetical protein
MVFDDDFDPTDFDDSPYLDDEPGYADQNNAYLQAAGEGILRLIDEEHAVVWPEVEAKLSDRPQLPIAPYGINPHHLTNARRQLIEQRLIEPVYASTKGGRSIATYGLVDRSRRQTAFDRAAARKRLLQTRYISWSGATAVIPNLIGEGGSPSFALLCNRWPRPGSARSSAEPKAK